MRILILLRIRTVRAEKPGRFFGLKAQCTYDVAQRKGIRCPKEVRDVVIFYKKWEELLYNEAY